MSIVPVKPFVLISVVGYPAERVCKIYRPKRRLSQDKNQQYHINNKKQLNTSIEKYKNQMNEKIQIYALHVGLFG